MHLIDRVAHTGKLAKVSAAEKMLFSLGMLALAISLPPWPGAVLVLVVVLAALFAVARVAPRDYLRVMSAPLLFLCVSLVPLFFTLSLAGSALPQVGLSPDGPQLALRVGLRVVAAVTCMLFLALTTPLPQVLMVLRRLRVPAVVTEIALLVYRYIWVFAHTVVTMRRAQSARLGYRTTRRSFRSLAMLVAALLGQSIQRGRALELGLESRNWDGELRVLDDGAPASAGTLALIVVTEAAVLVTALLWGSLA